MPNITLLGGLKRVLPSMPRDTAHRLTARAKRSLVSGTQAVRGAVEMFEPCVELDMARLNLIQAEMWIDRAHALKEIDP